jgi:hypothetical protein
MKRLTKQQRIAQTQTQPADEITGRCFAFFGANKFQTAMHFDRVDNMDERTLKYVYVNPLEFKTFNPKKYGYTHAGINAHNRETMDQILNDAQTHICSGDWFATTTHENGCWYLVFIKND